MSIKKNIYMYILLCTICIPLNLNIILCRIIKTSICYSYL